LYRAELSSTELEIEFKFRVKFKFGQSGWLAATRRLRVTVGELEAFFGSFAPRRAPGPAGPPLAAKLENLSLQLELED
jgi:hypothetical protein